MKPRSDRWRYSIYTGLLAGALSLLATWFTREHMMETRAIGAIGIWLLSGFIAVIFGLKLGERIWPHSLLRTSIVLALTYIIMIALGYRSYDGIALSALLYGPSLLAALLMARREWKKRRTDSEVAQTDD